MNVKLGMLIAGIMILPLTAADGLLPPLYQTADEIEAVVKSPELDKVLPDGEPIMGIRKNKKGYIVRTLRHRVQAVINYHPATRPGPARFDVTFQPAEKIDSGENE